MKMLAGCNIYHFMVLLWCIDITTSSIKWLNKEVADEEVWTREMCSSSKYHFTAKQRAVCRRNPDKMQYVSESATITNNECQTKFLLSKWNCVSINRAPHFGYDLSNGTRESAVVHALSASSIAYTIASKCATGRIANCACKHAIIHGRIQFIQKVCKTSLKTGVEFARDFIEPGEKKVKKVRAKSPLKAAMLSMQEHNRNVGFKVVEQIKVTKCICPGSTGSCQVKTCYQALPKFQTIAIELKKRYEEASRVLINTASEDTFTPAGNHNDVVSDEELIYSDHSVNVCTTKERAQRIKGRMCSLKPGAENHCNTFCCNGKYEERKIIAEAKCNCKFVWCCKLDCDICYSEPTRQFCV